ncbi:MAG: alpha-amylase family glycosyl hydrolase [Hyphomonadaceae bacterium]
MDEWWRGAVIYQIYPRSFRDASSDGVGDLAGVVEKLDYIARLGADGVWLSPFFRSPMRDYGYDVSDYCDVDPLFGALADFDALIARAHELGLKVIIDQVYSHSSDEHPWFAESRESRDNPKADWYVWADAKPDGAPPNNWQALFGGPSWEWDARRRQYYLHNFLVSQPDLNVRNPAVQDALLAAARFWLDRGVDGFRLDVANFFVQDAALRDNPAIPHAAPPARPHEYQRHLYDRSQPETLTFLARFRALLDSYPDRFAVGEIEDEEPLLRQREYTDGPDRLHTAYSFFLLRAQDAGPAVFKTALDGWSGARGWPAWSLSNHDVPRAATRLGGDDPLRAKQLLALLLCLRGTAFLYQGEELGLPQADVPFEKLRDPEAIRFWPKGIGRDGARTPMPWLRRAPNAGFSAGEPWLPVDPRHAALAVDAQELDADSVLRAARALIALRRAHPALRTGAWRALAAPSPILLFERAGEGERLLCAFNLGAARWSLPLTEPAEPIAWPLAGLLRDAILELPGYGGVLARLRSW